MWPINKDVGPSLLLSRSSPHEETQTSNQTTRARVPSRQMSCQFMRLPLASGAVVECLYCGKVIAWAAFLELIVMDLEQTFLIWRLPSVRGPSASQKPRGWAGQTSLHEFPVVGATLENESLKNRKPSPQPTSKRTDPTAVGFQNLALNTIK